MNKSRIRQLYGLFVILLFSLLLFPSLTASGQGKTLTLKMDNVPLEQVMNEIENQTQLLFFFLDDVDGKQTVSIDVDGKNLTATLDQLFRNLPIVYRLEGSNIVLSKKPAVTSVTLTGRVTDSDNNPVMGATVTVKGTTLGTSTGTDGGFSLQMPQPTASTILQVSFLGYETREIAVGNQRNINIRLTESAIAVENIVVTALGITRESKSLTYDVQQLTSDDLTRTNEANIMSGLAGKVAGVTINSSSSGIGGGVRVIMRGTKSLFSNNNALYVIDGIPMPNLSNDQPDDKYTGAGQSGDAISFINPDDIESMSILSGSAAAALYGVQAANGVVLINTKKGEAGRTSVSYSNNTTFYSPFVLPKFQNTYGSETGEWYSWSGKMAQPSSYNPKDYFQTGYNTTNTVSVSIGNEKTQTYVSAGTVHAEGIIPNNDYSRYNFTFRNTTKFLNDRMTLDFSFMYSKIHEQNMLSQGEYGNPLTAVYLFPRGDDIEKYKYYERYDIDEQIMTQYWPLGENGLSMQNPWWVANRNLFINNKDRIIANVALSYDLNDWLKVTGRLKMDRTNIVYEKKMYASTLSVLAENSSLGAYIRQDNKLTHSYADFMLSANKYFDGNTWSLSANAGAALDDAVKKDYMFGGGLSAVPNFFTYENIEQGGKLTYEQDNYHDRINSVFATVSAGYRGMVYVDASVRNDWMSALYGTDKKSIVYPSVGISGIISEMAHADPRWLSFAKVRASYSEVGNAPARFATQSSYVVAGGNLSTSTFLVTNLFPERTKAWEAGVNLAFFNNKLSLDMTFYRSMTYKQFFEPSISSSSGYEKAKINGGNVRNKGFELTAGLRQNIGPVNWNSTLIWTLNRNRIVEMLGDVDVYVAGDLLTLSLSEMDVYGLGGAKQRLVKGGSMGDIYVNQIRTDQHGHIWVNSMTGALEKDVNNYVLAGNNNPLYNLSWNNGFEWKGINFGFLITARVGGIGVSATQANLDYYGVSKASADARDNGGVYVNGHKLDAQTWYQTIGANGSDFIGSMYVYSMTNVRLSEVSLGYTIPIGNWSNVIKNINISFVGKNLCMFYKKAPFDPESTASTATYNQGIDYFMPPSMRSLGFSAKITF